MSRCRPNKSLHANRRPPRRFGASRRTSSLVCRAQHRLTAAVGELICDGAPSAAVAHPYRSAILRTCPNRLLGSSFNHDATTENRRREALRWLRRVSSWPHAWRSRRPRRHLRGSAFRCPVRNRLPLRDLRRGGTGLRRGGPSSGSVCGRNCRCRLSFSTHSTWPSFPLMRHMIEFCVLYRHSDSKSSATGTTSRSPELNRMGPLHQ